MWESKHVMVGQLGALQLNGMTKSEMEMGN